MAHPGVKALAVLCRRAARGAQRRAHDQRHLELTTRHVVNFRGLVDDLIHCQPDEVAEHNVYYRAHTGHRCPDAQPGNARFRDWRVEHPRLPKFLDQPGEHLEWRPGLGHVFTDDEHTRVTTHFFG